MVQILVIYLPPLSWNICVTGQNNLLSLLPLTWMYILLKVYLACIRIVKIMELCLK